jgi:hypothetical protein
VSPELERLLEELRIRAEDLEKEEGQTTVVAAVREALERLRGLDR